MTPRILEPTVAMSPRTVLARLLCIALACGLSGCTDVRLQKEQREVDEELDQMLRITGEFCTEPAADVTFPVKVLFILDQSASLQCTDSTNKRFDALNRAVNQLRSQRQTEFAFVGFSSWVRSSWTRDTGFTRNRDDIDQFLDPGQGLGPATDYQGALATAVSIIEQDMLATPPAELARTRYLVNFISDGIPEPRCNPGCEDDETNCTDDDDNDDDGLVDAADPDCANIDDNSLHPDNLYGVCNYDDEIPDDVYVDMQGLCPEYNQPYQIQQRVQELLALEDAYSAGGVTLNTVLLFSDQAVVESVCGGQAATQFGFVREQAKGLMQVMANAGGGTFRDVNLTTQGDDFLEFPVASVKADKTLSSMMAFSLHTRLRDGALVSDIDGDGLTDQREIDLRTDRESIDSDGDRYRDLFEQRMSAEGFEPADDTRPAVSCGSDRDGDGDGLMDCEETFLGTNPTQPDTDGDDLIDWIEVLMGTDPLAHDALADLDFDGITNREEVVGGSDPVVADQRFYRDRRVVYGIDDLGPRRTDGGERQCYDYDIRRIQLIQTPLVRDPGLNRILLFSAERPAQVAGVPGEIRVACFEAVYGGGSVKSPASGVIDMTAESIDQLRQRLQTRFGELGQCPWFGLEDGQLPRRDDVAVMMDACMPPKVKIGRKRYPQDMLVELLERNLRNNGLPKLPDEPWELFVPIQNFDPGQHCHRPWEFDLLMDLLDEAEGACGGCDVPE